MMYYEEKIRVADLLFIIKTLKDKIRGFETGEKYIQMKEACRKDIAFMERRLRQKENELAQAHAETVDVRRNLLQVNEDVVAEKEKELAAKDRELKKMEGRMYAALKERDEMHEKLHERTTQLYDAQIRIEELLEQIRELTARLNRDYTNSSTSSSMSPNHKKIANSREKTQRKPGGQPGHEHHGRKRAEPTRTVSIPAPKEFKDGGRYRPTGRTVSRQRVSLHVGVEVVEYVTPEYVCKATGKTVHAPFPDGVKDDVNYDGTVKAFAYLINNGCYVSLDKTGDFIREISGGKISLSKGMISKLSKEFSEKTKGERDEIYLKLLASPVMNADFTFGRVDGKQGTVIICAADGLVLYQGREKKGHEGVKGSPVELYQGIIVSDHEATFLDYGTLHQECLAHVERYLRSSIENEPGREWSTKMLDWVKKAIHTRNEAIKNDRAALDESEISELESEYDAIMEKARNEYEDDPPSEYFKDGYNLFQRMADGKRDYVLFLHDLSVPPTNNRAENAARKYKRKSAQAMCFRSMDGQDHFCDGLTILETMKANGESLFEGLARRFNKESGTG